MNKRISVLWTAFVTSLMLLMAFNLLVDNGDDVVNAEESASSDQEGYTWIDNRDPTPKVTYDWIDISSTGTSVVDKFTYYYSYYDVYYRQPTSPIDLPFTFNFYGKAYDKILIWPSGMASFGPTDYGYSYGNYGGPLPNTYVYTPKGCIAAMWTYGGMPASRTGSDCLTYSGVTEEGMGYFVISWLDMQVPYFENTYYNDQFATSQLIMYENGDLLVNIKDATFDYNYYSTVGICNEERDVGITYAYQDFTKISEERAVLFKQFKTEIREVQWTEGYGEDLDVYPAMAGAGASDYFAKVDIWSEKGLDSLETLDMIIGPGGTGENIVLKYDFETDSFRKIGDPLRMVVLNEDFSRATPVSTDPDNEAIIEFHFDFNFNWQRIDYSTILFKLTGSGVKGSSALFENQFRVVSHLKIVGNLTIEDSRGRELIKGDWVRGGDTIRFFGLSRAYADDVIPIQPPDTIQIGIKDIPGNIYHGAGTSDLDTYVFVDPIYGEMEYKLIFLNVTPESDESDDTKIKIFYTNGFVVQIDSDSPGLPSKLQVLPDDKTDQPQNYDDDRDVFIKWEDAIDQSSGVSVYHYSVNRNKAQARPSDIQSIPKSAGNNIALIENLPEGINRVYLWAEDLVGNQGNEIFIEVTIDLTGVTYGGFYPHTGIWNTQLRPTCSIFINDTLTGVDPLSIEYEFSTTGEVGLVGSWQNIPDTYASADSLRVVVAGWFKNGKENWIRFRSQDMAGNPYVISDAYNVWVDAESPRYRLVSHSEDEYQLNPYQEVRIMVEDLQAGVDAQTIEYRLTTRGQTKWTPWKAYKDGVSGRSVEVRIKETFRRGDDNFIQVRAKDLAGNPISYSVPFNIRINTYPEIVITEPSSGDLLFDNMDIVFDASDSFDEDGDLLTFKWLFSSSNGDEQVSIGDVARVITPLEVGEYTITLIVKDRVNNEVQQHFIISVGKWIPPGEDPDVIDRRDPTDSDLDGMYDWFEKLYKLDYLVKDANIDSDGDGYTNGQEFGDGRWFAQNLTNPQDPRVHPRGIQLPEDDEPTGPFAKEMLPLWGIVVLLIIVVIVTMMVVKSKKDKQVKRIKTVRNMRRIMPSVSWDQITTTAYMAPYTQGAALAAASGPALPPAAPLEVDQSTALPPAQEADIAAHEAAHAVQQTEATVDPQPAPVQPQPAPMDPQPAPVQPQVAPVEPAPAPQPEYQSPQ